MHDGDDVSALAAIHALGSVDHESVDELLLALLVDGDEPFAGHAAWAMAARRSTLAAIDALARLAAGEGFSAMLAERTLVEWARLGAVAAAADACGPRAQLDGRPAGRVCLRPVGPRCIRRSAQLRVTASS